MRLLAMTYFGATSSRWGPGSP